MGRYLEINRDNLVLALGDLRSVVKKNRVQKISNRQAKKVVQRNSFSGRISEAITNFKPELDLRGMRGENAPSRGGKLLGQSDYVRFPIYQTYSW
jgi:DNA mismatch repair protein MutS2